MSFVGPWYIEDIKVHPAKLQRLQTYLATGGAEGVLGSLDLRARELSTPGTSIRLAPGGLVIPNRAAGGSYESYSDKSDVEIEVPISATDGSGGRSDLVVARVENPYEAGGGWTAPPDDINDSYTKVVVVPNVSSLLDDVHDFNSVWSAASICRVDIPTANTATIEDFMITDLRSIAELGSQRITETYIASTVWSASRKCNNGHRLLNTQGTFIDWPNQATWQVPIPDWASSVHTIVIGTPATRQHAWGELRLSIDEFVTAPREFDVNMAEDTAINVYRPNLFFGGEYTIDPTSRGRVVTIKSQARAKGGNDLIADGVDTDGMAGCYFDVWLNFRRYPVYA